MADATQAAKTRLDRALAELERKVGARIAAPARASLPDDDLFARTPHDPRADDRVAELEAAANDAATALAEAAEALRTAMGQGDTASDEAAAGEQR
ncbi:hypothetical protein [Brevundimonas sp.]|uniref:hypothetical protein n=1 Tax=Brevundimonas sp. TaxID=1871086 RepID=UPI0035B23982